MGKQEIEDELAKAVLKVLCKTVKTGYDENGLGEFLQCRIDFKYLNNEGGVLVNDLEFSNELSSFRVGSN